MSEEEGGEEEVNFELLRLLMVQLKENIRRLYHRWEQNRNIMMENKEFIGELEDTLRELKRILLFIRTDIEEEEEFTTVEELELRPLTEKLERGEVLNADEVASLMRIEEFARSEGREELLREVERAFTKLGELTKNIAIAAGKMKETELRKGEIKEIDEDILIRRRKDGEVELIILRRKWEGR
ncbi:MAG: hypothetical protein N2V74_00380 [Candidatus Methanospirare jalkutatii]|nr:MAG: hypothetical protein N2V74_05475 [Candidatus Methanospirare jalkutatii]UYZ40192.1 MAG: hypothetical protein N2V74_00380 [Candidatus Methanospirare jalkutatii]